MGGQGVRWFKKGGSPFLVEERASARDLDLMGHERAEDPVRHQRVPLGPRARRRNDGRASARSQLAPRRQCSFHDLLSAQSGVRRR